MRISGCLQWPKSAFSTFPSHGTYKLLTKLLQHTKNIFFCRSDKNTYNFKWFLERGEGRGIERNKHQWEMNIIHWLPPTCPTLRIKPGFIQSFHPDRLSPEPTPLRIFPFSLSYKTWSRSISMKTEDRSYGLRDKPVPGQSQVCDGQGRTDHLESDNSFFVEMHPHYRGWGRDAGNNERTPHRSLDKVKHKPSRHQ